MGLSNENLYSKGIFFFMCFKLSEVEIPPQIGVNKSNFTTHRFHNHHVSNNGPSKPHIQSDLLAVYRFHIRFPYQYILNYVSNIQNKLENKKVYKLNKVLYRKKDISDLLVLQMYQFLFIRKESSVKVDSGYLSLIGFLVYRSLAHQEQNRFFTGHRPPHASLSPCGSPSGDTLSSRLCISWTGCGGRSSGT